MSPKHKPAKSVRGHPVVEDIAFLLRDEMRGHRLALEYERAELELKDHHIRSTVVVFGSSRTKATEALFDDVESGPVDRTGCPGLHAWYEEARTFGRIITERGGALSPVGGFRDNVITTGGGPGLMEAANRGASEAGGPSIGFNIRLPTEQKPNKYITPELNFHFHYFAVRKMHFAMRANALAVFPGGFGTLDELFEILTLKQTRTTRGMPVLLFCKEYWRTVVNFEALVTYGTISREDLALFDIVDTAEEGWDRMVERGLTTATPLRED
ncbi:MAG: 3-isopropylmalate dehydrogenase [Alphaproteobacteria bacterium BRH_c36]|nr:MAG: 3-isopropylmalate dehydrogenase [Alphaproteobacteria bacterium BRH_c36]